MKYQAAPEVMEWIENAQQSVRAGNVLDGRIDRDPDDDPGSDCFPEDDVGREQTLHDNHLNVPNSATLEKEKLHSLPDQYAPLGMAFS